MDALEQKLDQMIKLMDDSVHLQRVALLDQGHILHFHGPRGIPVSLSLPEAVDDFLQRVILRGRTFYEAKLLSMVQTMGIVGPQSLVCDVGANIGNHTVYFARVMGAARVMAFEPQDGANAKLAANIALNGLQDRVTAYHCMVGETTGNGRLIRFNPRNLGGSVFAPDAQGDVPLFALDDVLQPDDRAALDLIKIDVEGMQLAVLKGAADILANRKPALWIEILDRDPTQAETAAHLATLGYRATRLGPSDWLYR
jgi:FkbM family methyltransferase